MTESKRPLTADPYWQRYISLVETADISKTLEQQGEETIALLSGIGEERGGYRYAADKWSIKEIVGHIIDSERIFAYRAMRIGRGDQTPLAGFEQDDYVRKAGSDACTLASLIEEFQAVRRSTTLLFRHLPNDAWSRSGVANQKELTVRALAWIIAGHELHHRAILRDRYLHS